MLNNRKQTGFSEKKTITYSIAKVRKIFTYFTLGLVLGIFLLKAFPGLPQESKQTCNNFMTLEMLDIDEEEDPTGQAWKAIRILPLEDEIKALEPLIEYKGNSIEIRYYHSGGKYQIHVVKDQRAFSINMYTDNSTHRIPLMYGKGIYTVFIVEKISDFEFRTVVRKEIDTTDLKKEIDGATLNALGKGEQQDSNNGVQASDWNIDTSKPYLSQFYNINWSDEMVSVQKARMLCRDMEDEKEKAKTIYLYLVERLQYDYSLYKNIPSDYVPSLDNTLNTKKGICYDFASLYAGMMRSVNIPCKVVTGYNSLVNDYHAWNEVYYENAWHRIDITIDVGLLENGMSYDFEAPQGLVTSIKKTY